MQNQVATGLMLVASTSDDARAYILIPSSGFSPR